MRVPLSLGAGRLLGYSTPGGEWYAEVDKADMEMIEALQSKVDMMKEQAAQLEAMESKVKSMMARMRNKSPVEKRLEEKYNIDPLTKSLAEKMDEKKKSAQQLTDEERKAKAAEIKARHAAASTAFV